MVVADISLGTESTLSLAGIYYTPGLLTLLWSFKCAIYG